MIPGLTGRICCEHLGSATYLTSLLIVVVVLSSDEKGLFASEGRTYKKLRVVRGISCESTSAVVEVSPVVLFWMSDDLFVC